MSGKEGLGAAQIAASSVGAILAAWVGSRFGLAGTTLGAGVASIVTLGATTLTQRSLERTHRSLTQRLQTHRPEGPASLQDAATVRLRTQDLIAARNARQRLPRRRLTWKWAAVGMASVFLLTMGVLTMVELGLGHPLSGGSEGTTLTGLVGGSTTNRIVPTARPVPSLFRPPRPSTTNPSAATPSPSLPASTSIIPSTPPSIPSLVPTTPTTTTSVPPSSVVLIPVSPGVTP